MRRPVGVPQDAADGAHSEQLGRRRSARHRGAGRLRRRHGHGRAVAGAAGPVPGELPERQAGARPGRAQPAAQLGGVPAGGGRVPARGDRHRPRGRQVRRCKRAARCARAACPALCPCMPVRGAVHPPVGAGCLRLPVSQQPCARHARRADTDTIAAAPACPAQYVFICFICTTASHGHVEACAPAAWLLRAAVCRARCARCPGAGRASTSRRRCGG